jgi:RHS repeat-associated protein
MESTVRSASIRSAPSQTAQPRHGLAIPRVELPKGGGAIRTIGEKFAAHPTNGTATMSVPIATTSGRSGFGPRLSLAYDSAAGNGTFGFGWRLDVPWIARRTDKGLPQYRDSEDSDEIILSGSEELVPVYRQDANGDWVRDAQGELVVHEDEIDGYRVRRYRPRIEGLFSRIERWTLAGDAADVHWRVLSKDNVLSVYGSDTSSRIADPSDPRRIFAWLVAEVRDDTGNATLYRYKTEDGQGVDISRPNERNRGLPDDLRRTANRYLKRIHYGNRAPLVDADGRRPRFLDTAAIEAQLGNAEWMFEIVFDYGEHDEAAPTPNDSGVWSYRPDPFSTYRGGFEVRTTRLCQRVLMFHHFLGEAGVDRDCLVRSTDFVYSDEVDPTDVRNPVYAFLRSVTHCSYRRTPGGYAARQLPPVDFEYVEPIVQDRVEHVDAESLENLPAGLSGATHRWIDLHGDGVPGILSEQAGAWFYKRNISPIPESLPDGGEQVSARFGPLETVLTKPNVALNAGADFMDLAGDGQADVVVMDGPVPGLYEHDEAEGWQHFRAFPATLRRDLRDPNLRFVDLDGDGHADVLITEDEAFIWHPSRAEDGFASPRRVTLATDEESGPRIVFADGTQSIYLADMSGDALTDLVRIRNGEVCYWPNLGHGRFGAKVTMDNAPQFDSEDHFEQKRIVLADLDGSGTTDILYLHRDGVRLYFNQSGNSWGQRHTLAVVPRVDEGVSIAAMDLLGNGTACLVWSSPMPGDAGHQMRYVDLMGRQKPHLLVRTVNNMGAETRVHYAPSTKFQLLDKRAGHPWITKLPFPVHVVERIETMDLVSRSRFVTRYAYHHGYFDGYEREFRGFGLIEQMDTEQLAALTATGAPPVGDNIDAASHVAPVLIKTWFHTGVYVGREHVSDYFAGLRDEEDAGEYFRESGLTDGEARALLLADTTLPSGLSPDEEREACRSLKGMMLRQEIYALDGSSKQPHPYSVTEQNFTIRAVQPKARNRRAVFFSHPNEAITSHYERNPADPRVQHRLTLEVDALGNVLKEAAIAYGRRTTVRVVDAQGDVQQVPNPGLVALDAADRSRQTTPLATYVEHRVTNAVEATDEYRTPLPCEMRTFELTGYVPTGSAARFQASDFVEPDPASPGRLRHIHAADLQYEDTPSVAQSRRTIELQRTLYRADDLSALLPLGTLAALALHGERYRLALTPGFIAQVFQRARAGQTPEALISDAAAVLASQGGDGGGYVSSQALKADGRFPGSDPDDHWWIPSGRTFFTLDSTDAATELATARQHFFLARRYRDAFGQDTRVSFDPHDLLLIETIDALGNRVSAEALDYRVLQAALVSDPNRNRRAVAFDVLGSVVGTAVMGKPLPAPVEGDSLAGFVADVPPAQIDAFFDAADPHSHAPALLAEASTRVVEDLDRFRRTRQAHPDDPSQWEPIAIATLAREIHTNDPLGASGTPIQITFEHIDGFGRPIQKKLQAEPGPIDDGGAVVAPRWLGTAWTIFNNKGNPVRTFEPFFTATHRFEFGVAVGVSPVLFYDPTQRVIATVYPNHTYDKVVFDPWAQTTYDVNDTVAPRNQQTGDPRTDADVAGFVTPYFDAIGATPVNWRTWHAERSGGDLGVHERDAAIRTAEHADTPTTTHFDARGRPFLTIVRNRVVCPGHPLDGTESEFPSRVELDIEGYRRVVRDAVVQAGDPLGRVVMRYAFDMIGTPVHEHSMDAGARWMLNDVAGHPIRAWDSRGHNSTTTYDELRRPLLEHVLGTTTESDPRTLNGNVLVQKIEYGEGQANAEASNLRARVFRRFDGSGVLTNARVGTDGATPLVAYDFKGNLLHSTRRLASDYTDILDWQLDPPLDAEAFETSTRYDALNRIIQSIAPQSGRPNATRHVIQAVFNEASLLQRLDVWLERATEPASLLDPQVDAPSPVGVSNVDYDAKGQRVRIDYKNGAAAFYQYDPHTFRVVSLYTRRDATFTGDCDNPQPPPPTIAAPDAPPPGKPCGVQNLRYIYDPVGNITHIDDAAQQTLYFRNKRVEPANDYTYDALYRLIQATGREHLGQGGVPVPHSHDDAPRVRLPHPGDGNAMGTYVERYVYDAVGNFLEMQHRGSDPANPGWTRTYEYDETSLTEDGGGGALLKTSNRLSATQIAGGSTPIDEPYEHDAHGNVVRMPHLGGGGPVANIDWSYADQMRRVDLGGGGTAFFVYDAAGTRVRKVCEKAPGLIEERIYLPGFELFRRHAGIGGSATVRLERETLHVMDDQQRLALVEMRTVDVGATDPAPARMIRYQYGNHVGSAALELDDAGEIVSYEEYAPYGSTTYQAVRSQTETPKRYRYSGLERDEETGFTYHHARYCAPWLGCWISADPDGLVDGPNVFRYARNNPIVLTDTNGRNPPDPTLFATFESFADASPKVYTHEYLLEVWEGAHGPMTPAAPRSVTYNQARSQANSGARAFRVQQGMTGAVDQAAHTIAARHVPLSGISRQAANAPETFMILTSRHGHGMSVQMTGHPNPLTPHNAQEQVINACVRNATDANGVLTPQAHQASGAEVRWRLNGSGFDVREANIKRASGYFDEAAAIENSSKVQAYRASKAASSSSAVSSSSAASSSSVTSTVRSEVATETAVVRSGASTLGRGAGVAVKGGLGFLSAWAAYEDWQEGDEVGTVLNVTAIAGPQVIVTAPAAGWWEGIKSGGKLMKMQVDCSEVAFAYEMDEITVDHPDLQYCIPLINEKTQKRFYQEYFEGF